MPKYKRSTSYMGPKATNKRTGESKFATQAQANSGTLNDVMISPATLDTAIENLIQDGTTTQKGVVRLATVAESVAGALDTVANTPAGLAAVAIAGAPDASEILKGILELATQAEVTTGTDDARAITPLKFVTALASPPAIGGTAPDSGAFTNLAATGVGTGNLMTSDTASNFSVTGALADLTLNSDAGRVIINGEEAADNAITLVSAAGGIDLDSALSTVISTSENTADALQLVASAGGIDVTAAGAAGEDIDIVCTAGSVNITAGESAADSVVITSSIGGIDITAAGAAAGEDIDISSTGSSVNISASENAADAITLTASAGGIDISATGTAGEDIDITATGSSVNVTATENAAKAIYLHANGGTSETIDIHADQGTGVASISLLSDVGGVTISGGVASADAVNIACGNAAGGVDIDSGTGGTIMDSTGAISLDAAAASNFTVTGAGIDLTLDSAAGRVVVNGEEAATDAITLLSAAGGIDVNAALEINIDSSEAAVADAVRIVASAANGGIDIDAGTSGITIDSTGAISLGSAAASDFTVTGAFDLGLTSSAGSVNITAGEAAADAIVLNASGGGVDITAAANDMDLAATLGSVNITANEAVADGIVINSAGGGVDITAATNDMDLVATAGSVNITAGESAADSIVISSSIGGIDITAAGAAAGEDIDITATGSSVNITATEADSKAIKIDASDAAGGVEISAGTTGILFSSGQIVNYTAKSNADTPYTVVGTDYFIGTDTTGGVLAITMPAVPETGREYVIYDATGQAAGNNVTITGNAGNIVTSAGSAATYVLNAAYESVTLVWNGTLWLGRNI